MPPLWYAIVVAFVAGEPAHIDVMGTAPTRAVCEENLARLIANSAKVNPPEVKLAGQCAQFTATPK